MNVVAQRLLLMHSKPNPDKPNHKRSITKARNDESTKRSQENFRVFQLSCFRDKKSFFIKCKEFTTKTLINSIIPINLVRQITGDCLGKNSHTDFEHLLVNVEIGRMQGPCQPFLAVGAAQTHDG